MELSPMDNLRREPKFKSDWFPTLKDLELRHGSGTGAKHESRMEALVLNTAVTGSSPSLMSSTLFLNPLSNPFFNEMSTKTDALKNKIDMLFTTLPDIYFLISCQAQTSWLKETKFTPARPIDNFEPNFTLIDFNNGLSD